MLTTIIGNENLITQSLSTGLETQSLILGYNNNLSVLTSSDKQNYILGSNNIIRRGFNNIVISSSTTVPYRQTNGTNNINIGLTNLNGVSTYSFCRICNINNRIPKASEEYKNININSWLGFQKKKINDMNNTIYINLSENSYVKKSLDNYLENKELNKDKEKLNYEQWKILLFEFCNINKRIPKKDEIYKNNKITSWLQEQKKKINNINSIVYINLSENEYVKKSLDKYLINKEKKLNYEQWKNLLFEFSNINKRVPKNNEKYKNNKIWMWLNDQKKKLNDINSIVYINLSENEYVKKSLDDYLNKKILK
jgi:hypothetical protein